jgi:hypothetical protein
MSIFTVVSQRPGLIWLCDSSGIASSAQNTIVIIRRDFIASSSKLNASSPDGF